VVTLTKDAVEHRTTAHGALLDIEGAFDRTLFKVIKKAVEQHGIRHTICWWIGSMLASRKITATLAGEALKGSVANGCLLCGGGGGTFYHLAVEPGCGQTHNRTQIENGLHTLIYADDRATLI
jgi:hypothetical protein